MNVIISNENSNILNNLGIDVIKNLSGEFSAEEIITTFSTFYYQRMIVDITSIKNYKNWEELRKIALGLDPSKIILILNEDKKVNSDEYYSNLVTMGIYNFSKNRDGLMYLLNNPNSYNDVAYLQRGDMMQSEKLSNSGIDIFASNTETTTPTLIYDTVKIIGFRNITEHAGATTLIYMLKCFLESKYKVKCIEVDNTDFMYFNDKNMESTTKNNLNMLIPKHADNNFILIDLNSSGVDGICNDVIYLAEPSTIKLNKMIKDDKDIFNKLSGRKIVLNQSLLDEIDVADFEKESGSKIFYNISPLDDKRNNDLVLEMFSKAIGII